MNQNPIPPFNSWKVGAPYYLPCLIIGVILAIVFRNSAWVYTSVPFLLLGVYILFFFRDPFRIISAETADIVAPADGTIVGIEDLEETPYYTGPCKRISIFLSLFNVHINRAPVSGTIYKIEYKSGEFLNAMKSEAGDLNEANALYMDSDRGRLTVRQIAGLVARRIVCLAKEGDNIDVGQKFGMIRFGSRTELYLPPDTEICVKPGDKVKAGSKIVARFK